MTDKSPVSAPLDDRTDRLILCYLDGQASVAEIAELRAALLTDPSVARRLFLQAELQGDLQEVLRHMPPQTAQLAASTGRTLPAASQRRLYWLVPLAAAASLAIFLGVSWLVSPPPCAVQLAEVRGAVSGFMVQGAGGIEKGIVKIEDWNREAVGSDQAAGVMASPRHRVTGLKVASHKPLKPGDTLRPGDGVSVGADGYVKLTYPDGTQVELHGGTRLQLLPAAGADKDAKRLSLSSGLLVCAVVPQKSSFQLETPHGVAEVVGTRFSLGVNAAQTTLAVQEGEVALRQADRKLTVKAGETVVADAKGTSPLAPADAWLRELLVRAETGPWDVVNLGTGILSNDVWRMDARGGPADRKIWNLPVEARDVSEASVVQFAGVRRPVRGVIACRMMIRPAGQPAPEVAGAQAVTNGAWRTSRLTPADMPSHWRDSRRGCLRLDYNLSGSDLYWLGDVLDKAAHLSGVWQRFVVYVDTERPDGMYFVFSVWPDGSVPPAASAWMVEFDKGTVTGMVKIGLMTKGVLMEVQGLKFVPLGPDMPLPPKELLNRK